MAIVVFLVLFFALMTGLSSATYCVCKDGVGQAQLQKALDYACGAGADCTPILQNGACYQPNTVQDHCSYAVNSYFQRKNQIAGSCDFSGAAQTNPSPPSGVTSSCVYPSSPGNAGTGGTTSPTGTPGTGTPTTTPGTGTTPSTNTGTGTTPTSSTNPTFGSGLGPTGTTGINDSNGGVRPFLGTKNFFSVFLTLLWSSTLLVLLWA